MGQQPNVELQPADRPRPVPEPGPARRWRPTRPGDITAPEQMRWGGAFGTPGPDTGYAMKLIAQADLPGRSPLLERLVATLMGARASLLGRAPILEDLEVAKEILGLGENPDPGLAEQRVKWMGMAAHEKIPGQVVVAEIDPELLRAKPAGVRRMRRLLNR
ncbi:MAG: hypothetical protein Q8Q52_03185 [Acidimicrobiia bacterium]|nr:hypothetical protein [Acidimicrobiia bacterium]